MSTQQKLYRFYRSNLETIVWNPAEGKALAEFVNGQYFTEDKEVAEKLKALGYPEIPLDLQEPPEIFFKRGRSLSEGEDVAAIPRGATEEVMLQKERVALEQKALQDKAQTVAEKKETRSPAEIALENSQGEQTTTTETKVDKSKPKKTVDATVTQAEKIAKEVVSKRRGRKIKRRNRK